MNCPVCHGTALVMSERNGIEIDYCPQCRGVWLDRGELDKIIERAAGAAAPAVWDAPAAVPAPIPAQAAPQYQAQSRDPRYDHRDRDDHYRDDDRDHRGRKKRGFLGDLFDFD